MRRVPILMLFCASLLFGQAQPQTPSMVTITGASFMVGPSKHLLANGTITFTPTDMAGNPILSEFGGPVQNVPAGQILPQGTSAFIVNGAITTDINGGVFQVADSELAFPANLCYTVTIRDTGAHPPYSFPPYKCVQPTANNTWCTSGVCNFDMFQYTQNPLVEIQGGPTPDIVDTSGQQVAIGVPVDIGVPWPAHFDFRLAPAEHDGDHAVRGELVDLCKQP